MHSTIGEKPLRFWKRITCSFSETALEISSNSKGFLAPRVPLTSALDVSTVSSPAIGLMVYNTASAGSVPNAVTPGYYYFSGTKWERLITATTDALKKGDRVALVGFGSFSVSARAARKGRNPQTGKEITIKPSKRVKFSAGKALKDSVK